MNKMFIPRAYILMGLCLPLAVLLGYFIAEPMDLGSLGVVVLILSVLSLPLLMKWYHPLLVFSCNSPFIFAFLPGMLPLWLVAALMGTFFFLLNLSLDGKRRIMVGGAVPWALLCLGVVVVLTAWVNGGIGFQALGSAQQGGKRYLLILAAIAAYFVLANIRVPASRAQLYGGLFFLSAVAGGLSFLAWLSGDKLYGLFYLLGLDPLAAQGLTASDALGSDMVRLANLTGVCQGGCLFLMFRYGAAGLLDLTKWWRAGLMLLLLAAGMLSGFRGTIVFLLLVFLGLFLLEGLHKTRHALRLGLVGCVCAAGLVAFSAKLPLSMQRTVCFLPVKVDPSVRLDAQNSIEWRLAMWQEVWPEVPRYLFKGRGFAMDLSSVSLDYYNQRRGFGESWRSAEKSSEFHNGPLSVLIPFGLWGALALAWFALATLRRLHRNYVHGEPTLKSVNRMFLAYFAAKLVWFVFFFGTFQLDLISLAVLAGLAVSLNGEDQKSVVEAEAPLGDSPVEAQEALAGYGFGEDRFPVVERRRQPF